MIVIATGFGHWFLVVFKGRREVGDRDEREVGVERHHEFILIVFIEIKDHRTFT